MLNKSQLGIHTVLGNRHGIVLFIQKSIIGKDARPLSESNQLQIPMLKKRIDYGLLLKGKECKFTLVPISRRYLDELNTLINTSVHIRTYSLSGIRGFAHGEGERELCRKTKIQENCLTGL
jgi:hypothetical protein